jgi:hypothetical protein
MKADHVLELIRILAWPAVVVAATFMLRRQLSGLVGRVRGIEGPGSLKIVLDESRVEQIIAEGRKDNAPASAVAERIVQTATVLDPREARILRALFDDDGRALFNYRNSYYHGALDSLIAKGHVRTLDRGFALTDDGQALARKYLLDVLRRREGKTDGQVNGDTVPGKA